MRKPLGWDEVFLMQCAIIAQRSKDPSTRSGAILVSNDHITLSTGFNGPPATLDDNLIPWEERPQKYAYIIHAEENALWVAAGSHGFDRIKGSTMYCTHLPCAECITRMCMLKVARVIVPGNCPDYPMSKFLVEPQSILDTQKFPKLEIIRV